MMPEAAMNTTGKAQTINTRCCIVGGGPAGMMAGFLLARAGVDVVVLEKHADFLRDFRGDTIHPSTLELMHELGLLDEFLKLPHQKIEHLSGLMGTTRIRIADFTHLPTHCRFIALMPQWDFLNFLADHGRRYPTFKVMLRTEAHDLIQNGGRVTGVVAHTPDGEITINADLVIAADGRHSILRDRAGFRVNDIGAPMDVFWMRLSRRPSDSNETFGRFAVGALFVMLNRGDYWQCAYVIPKGSADAIRAQGIATFREKVTAAAPEMRDRLNELRDWDDVKLLTVAVDRLETWHKPGLLCIGDAAHAMSPIGGVGINLAVQDAVAAANILAASLLRGGPIADSELAAVQKRRLFPTRFTQWLQVTIQKRIVSPVLASTTQLTPPWPVRLIDRCPLLQRIPARLVGVGVRPEHVRTPEAARQPTAH
jgi:2-polyprenyl-6-methoxyphenol hydroxylase-like FAD-dependent oxidoreductase